MDNINPEEHNCLAMQALTIQTREVQVIFKCIYKPWHQFKLYILLYKDISGPEETTWYLL
jgi:hypothetical protein